MTDIITDTFEIGVIDFRVIYIELPTLNLYEFDRFEINLN